MLAKVLYFVASGERHAGCFHPLIWPFGMRPCILAKARHSRQDSQNDRIEKDTKGILCIFVKDDDDNNNNYKG